MCGEHGVVRAPVGCGSPPAVETREQFATLTVAANDGTGKSRDPDAKECRERVSNCPATPARVFRFSETVGRHRARGERRMRRQGGKEEALLESVRVELVPVRDYRLESA